MPLVMTDQQLEKWYERFSKELYEKVNIDVKRKEDLGRVKNFGILDWDEENPGAPKVDLRYVYIPQKDMEYEKPSPEIQNFEAYARWLTENLKPDLTLTQMRRLYELSCAGTLMVQDPTGNIRSICQILTQEDGTIVTSRPMNEYELPEAPDYVPEPNVETFGFTGCPERPKCPENKTPNQASYMGYLLGFNTAYRKLKDYNEQMETYQQQWDRWHRNLENTQPEMMAQFRQVTKARQQFQQDFEAFKATPLGVMAAIDRGFCAQSLGVEDPKVFQEFLSKEAAFLRSQHGRTVQGQIFESLKEVQRIWDYEERAEKIVHDFVVEEKGGDLAQEAVLAALADPQVSDDYSVVLSKFFAAGKATAREQELMLEPAREIARDAVSAYSQSDPEPLGELLAQSIRLTNRELTQLDKMDERKLNSLYLTGRLREPLQNRPELKEAAGLTPDEWQETQSNEQLYQLIRQGIESKKMLLEHALYKRNMKPAELQNAALNVIFAAHLEAETLLSHVKIPNAPNQTFRKSNQQLLNPQWVEDRKQNLLIYTELTKVKAMSREEIGMLFADRSLQILKALTQTAKRGRNRQTDNLDLELELDEDFIQFIMG